MKTVLRTWAVRRTGPPPIVTPAGRAALGVRKLATLTPEEDREWDEQFAFAVQDLKYGGDRAAAYAWRWLQKIFPRLLAFDGCHPVSRKKAA